MTTRTSTFDAADYIGTAEDGIDLLNDAVDSGDPQYIAYALGAVARARGGIGRLASNTGLSRQALHKALSGEGNPTLVTTLKVLAALGLHMRIEAAPPKQELADA